MAQLPLDFVNPLMLFLPGCMMLCRACFCFLNCPPSTPHIYNSAATSSEIHHSNYHQLNFHQLRCWRTGECSISSSCESCNMVDWAVGLSLQGEQHSLSGSISLAMRSILRQSCAVVAEMTTSNTASLFDELSAICSTENNNKRTPFQPKLLWQPSDAWALSTKNNS